MSCEARISESFAAAAGAMLAAALSGIFWLRDWRRADEQSPSCSIGRHVCGAVAHTQPLVAKRDHCVDHASSFIETDFFCVDLIALVRTLLARVIQCMHLRLALDLEACCSRSDSIEGNEERDVRSTVLSSFDLMLVAGMSCQPYHVIQVHLEEGLTWLYTSHAQATFGS